MKSNDTAWHFSMDSISDRLKHCRPWVNGNLGPWIEGTVMLAVITDWE